MPYVGLGDGAKDNWTFLKHETNGATILREERKGLLDDKTRKPRLTKDDRETIQASVTYFTNQNARMDNDIEKDAL